MSITYPLTTEHFNRDGTLTFDQPAKVIILFYRNTCPHCVEYHPVYNQLAKQGVKNAPGVLFAEVNTEEEPEVMKKIGKKFKLTHVPMVVSYYQGDFYSKMGDINNPKYGFMVKDPATVMNYANGIGTADITILRK